MNRRVVFHRGLLAVAVLGILVGGFPGSGLAQFGGGLGGGGFGGGGGGLGGGGGGFGGGGGGFGGGGGGFGGGGGGLGGGGGGGSTIGTGESSGVSIDAAGVLRMKRFQDPTGQLLRARLAQAQAALDFNLQRPSRLRKVSLTRLEMAAAQRMAAGEQLSDAMKRLAGLSRLQYVFYYPETRDVVVAGPAEPWAEDLSGRAIGLSSGRPIVELEDLVVALRAFPPSGQRTPQISCSIDPTPEGLARMQRFLRRIGSRATPGDTKFIVNGLRQSLGLQTISIEGISAQTRFAQVLVEADYRMKRIGIGLERPPIKLASYVARVNPSAVSRNAMQRWYFVPDYARVRASEDGLAMELVGGGVKLIGEDEFVASSGARRKSTRVNRASKNFVRDFSKNYAKLASRMPVYAELRNVIDLAIAAAFIQQQDYYAQAQWRMELLGNEAEFPVQTQNSPKQVATAVNSLWKGNRLMTPVGGGVQIRPQLALEADNLLTDEDGAVQARRGEVNIRVLPPDQWWWD